MSAASFQLSQRALQTGDQPISYFMQQAVENPKLISLAAGLVDAGSLPAAEVRQALDDLLASPPSAQAALQYGTTQGYAPLREKLLARTLSLDGLTVAGTSLNVNNVVVTTGSQQLLYLVGEVLLNPGDIVITEAPSYFVYHGVLSSLGARTLMVPMDEDGLNVDALEELLQRLDQRGELERLRLIYTCDYFQNPTGLTLSLPRRQRLLELTRRYSRHQRIFILEDAAYRELRFDGPDLPSIKSFDDDNAHVILTMTFSKPLAPGLKTGYGLLPDELVQPLLRFKGNHDFGSVNLAQHLIDRLLDNGAFDRHVVELCQVYRHKRDTLLKALAESFGNLTPLAQGGTRGGGLHWTHPGGGLYVWLSFPPGVATGPDSPLMRAALQAGVLYVPGQFCYVNDGQPVPSNEARLCFGVATPDQLHEAMRRLQRALEIAQATTGNGAPGKKDPHRSQQQVTV